MLIPLSQSKKIQQKVENVAYSEKSNAAATRGIFVSFCEFLLSSWTECL